MTTTFTVMNNIIYFKGIDCTVGDKRSWTQSCTKLDEIYEKNAFNASFHHIQWKFQDFSDTQILHNVNFGHFEAPKTVILTI